MVKEEQVREKVSLEPVELEAPMGHPSGDVQLMV